MKNCLRCGWVLTRIYRRGRPALKLCKAASHEELIMSKESDHMGILV